MAKTEHEFKLWLGGLLEGLAGRELGDSFIERVIAEARRTYGFGPVRQQPDKTSYADEPEPAPMEQPKTLAEVAERRKKLPPKKQPPAMNATPAAEKPPYDPTGTNPAVVRLQ